MCSVKGEDQRESWQAWRFWLWQGELIAKDCAGKCCCQDTVRTSCSPGDMEPGVRKTPMPPVLSKTGSECGRQSMVLVRGPINSPHMAENQAQGPEGVQPEAAGNGAASFSKVHPGDRDSNRLQYTCNWLGCRLPTPACGPESCCPPGKKGRRQTQLQCGCRGLTPASN